MTDVSLVAIEPAEVIEQPSAIEQITRGEVDLQVSTAKRYPRSIERFNQHAMAMAVKNVEVAKSCFYVLPRGGKRLEGPSIRLAEIAAVCWGNLRCDVRILDADATMVTAQATAWDLETNVLIRRETKRRITDRSGRRFSDDMIVVTGNAAAAIALRNSILTVIPRAYVLDVMEHCKRVAAGERGTLDQAKAKWMAWFEKQGVSKARVLELLGRTGAEDITIEDIATLQGVSTALSEGETTIDELFAPAELTDGVKRFGFKARQEAKEKAEAATAAETETTSQQRDPNK